MTERKKKKWRHIFLEIALRAIRKTHYEFGVWELGQEKLTLQHFKNLNQGNGINFAAEETVRDSIIQEITYTGLWKEHTINDDPSSYWIDREVKIVLKKGEAIRLDIEKKFFNSDEYAQPEEYSNDEKLFKIDLVFKRIQLSNKFFGDSTYPSLIEAKRFRLVTVDHRSSTLEVKEPQLAQIDRDILKLKLIKDYYNGKQLKIREEVYDKFFTYILLWGTDGAKFNLKTDVINKLSMKNLLMIDDPEDEDVPIVKYLPIEWDYNSTDGLIVKTLLWLALIELK